MVVGRRPGWELTHAGHGQLGLDLAVADPPDLSLLELHLPDLPGAEMPVPTFTDPYGAARPAEVPDAERDAD